MARLNQNNNGIPADNLKDKLIHVNRVSKTVKGGKNFSFSAIVVVGDGAGKVGFGTGKALEIQSAVAKATKQAKNAMIRVPLKEGRTLHHDMVAKYGAGKVVLRTATPGTGIIAGGPLRAIFECLGVSDVVAKSQGSNNPHNMVRATFAALSAMNSPKSVATRRSKPVTEIIAARDLKEKKDVVVVDEK